MLEEKIITAVEEILEKREGKAINIQKVSRVGGGSINRAFKLRSQDKSYFLKCNDGKLYPGMFEAEDIGLKLLAKCGAIRTPEVLHTSNAGGITFILMEFLEEDQATAKGWRQFGKGLANLHRQTSVSFGLDHDNYIGSLPQLNEQNVSWSEFYMACRLQPLIEMASDQGNLDASTDNAFENFFKEIDSIFPAEPPSLLHGDLWSGNYFFTADELAVIFDPAVYFGHREMDIAMTTLFGSCDQEFYTTYNQYLPLEKGWESRLRFANLYPLLAHLVLFGRSYLSQIKHALKDFT